jgi:hypothetical protein
VGESHFGAFTALLGWVRKAEAQYISLYRDRRARLAEHLKAARLVVRDISCERWTIRAAGGPEEGLRPAARFDSLAFAPRTTSRELCCAQRGETEHKATRGDSHGNGKDVLYGKACDLPVGSGCASGSQCMHAVHPTCTLSTAVRDPQPVSYALSIGATSPSAANNPRHDEKQPSRLSTARTFHSRRLDNLRLRRAYTFPAPTISRTPRASPRRSCVNGGGTRLLLRWVKGPMCDKCRRIGSMAGWVYLRLSAMVVAMFVRTN